jgi:hypothetical protein
MPFLASRDVATHDRFGKTYPRFRTTRLHLYVPSNGLVELTRYTYELWSNKWTSSLSQLNYHFYLLMHINIQRLQ